MNLPEGVACQKFEIWQPRWHDRKVLLAAHKVGSHNLVKFTKAPTLEGEYYISGRDVFQCDRENNGKIDCYAVPLKFLEPLERRPRSAKQQELFR
jgi:hypothetical protein